MNSRNPFFTQARIPFTFQLINFTTRYPLTIRQKVTAECSQIPDFT